MKSLPAGGSRAPSERGTSRVAKDHGGRRQPSQAGIPTAEPSSTPLNPSTKAGPSGSSSPGSAIPPSAPAFPARDPPNALAVSPELWENAKKARQRRRRRPVLPLPRAVTATQAADEWRRLSELTTQMVNAAEECLEVC
jgi:hypothetical protein